MRQNRCCSALSLFFCSKMVRFFHKLVIGSFFRYDLRMQGRKMKNVLSLFKDLFGGLIFASSLFFMACGSSPEDEWLIAQSVQSEFVSDFEREVVEELNLVRQTGFQCGSTLYVPAGTVRIDEFLQVSATEHAEDMIEHNEALITTADGRSELRRAVDAGANFEHLKAVTSAYGWDHTDAITLVEDALAEEETCRKIMDTQFTHVGFSLRTNIDAENQAAIFWSLVLGHYDTSLQPEPVGPNAN